MKEERGAGIVAVINEEEEEDQGLKPQRRRENQDGTATKIEDAQGLEEAQGEAQGEEEEEQG
jgi:hypothetical protein